MATATLSRAGTTVEIPLLANSSGVPLCGRDIGKPNLRIQETGSLDPRHVDQWSGLESYTITGRFIGSNAYSDAIALCDLLKSNSNGNQLTLNIDMPEYDTDIPVAPAAGQDEAVNIAYEPGRRNQVDVDLGLTRADTIAGGDQTATTPTASGSGPVELSFGNTTVALTEDITVSRSVGRPKSVIRRNPSGRYPIHIDKFKTAYDYFEISAEFNSNTVSQVNDIVDMFSQQLGRNAITLDFNGLYGMGQISVVPDGSGALRHVRPSGQEGTGLLPTISLRRVL